jgi:hypothetical protein
MSALITHTGGCHCGAVRFEVTAPADIVVAECDCSMCRRFGFLHLIVIREHFKLLQGEEQISTYTFNTGTAKHSFCRVCGVKSFYVPRSHPNGISVNVRCLDEGTVKSMKVEPFDGKDWDKGNADYRGTPA